MAGLWLEVNSDLEDWEVARELAKLGKIVSRKVGPRSYRIVSYRIRSYHRTAYRQKLPEPGPRAQLPTMIYWNDMAQCTPGDAVKLYWEMAKLNSMPKQGTNTCTCHILSNRNPTSKQQNATRTPLALLCHHYINRNWPWLWLMACSPARAPPSPPPLPPLPPPPALPQPAFLPSYPLHHQRSCVAAGASPAQPRLARCRGHHPQRFTAPYGLGQHGVRGGHRVERTGVHT